MKDLKDLFVSYEIALALKKKGFDYPCLFAYKKTPKHLVDKEGEFCLRTNGNPFGTLDGRNWNTTTALVSAPLYQQVIDWFSDKKNRTVNYYPLDRDKTIRGINEHLTLIS